MVMEKAQRIHGEWDVRQETAANRFYAVDRVTTTYEVYSIDFVNDM